MKETYQGIRGFDITTAGHLPNPEQAFYITNILNKNRPEKEWVGLEIYPMVERTVLPNRAVGILNGILDRFGLGVLPQGVTIDELNVWEQEYPVTKISRVHLPFSANVHELLHRPILGELENGPVYMAYAAMWVLFMGAATNRQGIEIAKEFGAGINAHTNVLEYFGKRGQLSEIKKGVPLLLAENERNFRSPVLPNRMAITDPATIISDIVQEYPEVDGLLLGLNHDFPPDEDLTTFLDDDEIVRNIFAMHISHPAKRGKLTHDVVYAEDPRFAPFLKKASETFFSHPVRLALDYNPLVMQKMTLDEQVDHYRETIAWMEKTQG